MIGTGKNEETQNYIYKKNKKLGVYYSDLIPVLTKAIQEQQSIIESLKFNVNEVKDREDENLKLIIELRQEIDALRNELNNKSKNNRLMSIVSLVSMLKYLSCNQICSCLFHHSHYFYFSKPVCLRALDSPSFGFSVI